MAAILRSGGDDGEASSLGTGPGHRRALLAVALAALAVWLWVALPLATGQRTFFFRDVLGNHFALKSFGAAAMERGEIPAFNPTLGMGQPFRGNPSALAFYPGNALYTLLPFWSAFGLHYALHWLLAALAMHALARRLGLGREAALLAGLTYAGSGFMLSSLSFYNLLAVAAWWPLAMAGAVTGGRRGVALGGAACGMALLAGEPLTAALGMAPLAYVACRRHGFGRGALTAFGVGAVGLLVAAPQVVATWRILGHSFRGAEGVTLGQAADFALPPLRLAELLVPLPFGWPLDVGPHGWWLGRSAPGLGYFLSLYVGIVALWLAVGALRRRPGWAAFAGGGLAAAVLFGLAPGVLRALTGGLFRFPEKFLFWFALALPLLAAHGLEAALGHTPRESTGTSTDEPGGETTGTSSNDGKQRASQVAGTSWRRRGAFAAAAVLGLAALAVVVASPGWVAAAPLPEVIAAQAVHWAAYLAVAALLLAATAVALGRRSAVALVALQLVALVQLFPLLRTTPTEPFRQQPPWAEHLAEGTGVVNTLLPRPTWEPLPGRTPPDGSRATNDVRNALDLYPAPGVAYGLTYPLAPDVEGLAPPLYTFLSVEVTRLDWRRRLPWLRATGVGAVVAYRPPGVAGLTPLDVVERQGVPARLYRVEGAAPAAWWPRRVEPAAGPRAAFARVSEDPAFADPRVAVVTARPVEHDPDGRARLVSAAPDELVVDVASERGGLLVVRRAYHPLYTARDDRGERLATQPVELALLGVEVPAGERRVTLTVEEWPETAALVVSLAALLSVGAVAWRTRRRQRPGDDGGETKRTEERAA
ncbi:MAG TPA: hypothetical protein VKU40_02295 [Thermoanaerobaculia bacterium]|nr:hypothetical protein [Thermoanaerobaculia bacterium]